MSTPHSPNASHAVLQAEELGRSGVDLLPNPLSMPVAVRASFDTRQACIDMRIAMPLAAAMAESLSPLVQVVAARQGVEVLCELLSGGSEAPAREAFDGQSRALGAARSRAGRRSAGAPSSLSGTWPTPQSPLACTEPRQICPLRSLGPFFSIGAVWCTCSWRPGLRSSGLVRCFGPVSQRPHLEENAEWRHVASSG